MNKWVCPVCKYIHESKVPPSNCPVCFTEGKKFAEKKEKSEI